MPYSMKFEPAHDVVTGTATGSLRLHDAFEGAVSVWEHREWKGKSVVWDFRSARFEMTADAVRELAQFVTRHQPFPRPPRVALVVATEVGFGLARMFGALREDVSTEVRVFQDYEDAVAWASRGRIAELQSERS